MGFTPDVDNLHSPGQEPGHASAAIQPHGALLSLDGSGRVVQLAGDTGRAIGLAPEALLGQSIDALQDSEGRGLACALDASDSPLPGYLAHWRPRSPGEGVWDVTAHASAASILVEFEPADPVRHSAAEGMAGLGRAIVALEQPLDLDELFRAAAREVRRMTGFDRVLVYRFLDDNAGTVVAQAGGDGLPALPDHLLPGVETSSQARRLHLRNRVLAIPDARYIPAPLHRADAGDPPKPLDMSECSLRSVSRAHLQHLADLRVAASMSIPVVVDDALWGLIVCHHAQPRYVPYELREACWHVGRVFSQQIGTREKSRHERQGASLRTLRASWLDELRQVLDAGGQAELDPARLATMVPCDGVAVVSAGRVALAGHTPCEAQARVLAAWLDESLRRDVFATDHLAGALPAATAYAANTCGLLATSIGTDEPVVLMWFRVDDITRLQQNWKGPRAGEKAPAPQSQTAALVSAEQTIRGSSRQWTRAETSAVRQLGRSLTAIFQQQALRGLNSRLRDALAEQETLVAQKNLLMMEVHHRVQNSLQIVNSMLQLQARQTTDPRVRAPFESAVNRLMAVSAVHRHLWRSSDAQTVHLEPYLEELCADLMLSWGDGWSGHVTVTACDIAIPSQTAVTLALLVTELLTNAAKYAYAGAPGPVVLQVTRTDDDELHVSVCDHGRGIQDKIQGSGLGSKLIRIFTAQLGGNVQTKTGVGGTTVTIAMPLPQRKPTAAAERGSTTPA